MGLSLGSLGSSLVGGITGAIGNAIGNATGGGIVGNISSALGSIVGAGGGNSIVDSFLGGGSNPLSASGGSGASRLSGPSNALSPSDLKTKYDDMFNTQKEVNDISEAFALASKLQKTIHDILMRIIGNM
jgi:hypothetical protein